MALSRVKSDVIASLDAAKIEGALPAIDGSPLIGVTGGVDSVGRNNLALNYFEDLIRDSVDRLALTQGWIDTFEDTSDVDGEGVSVPMTKFDGVNDYLTRGAGLTGATDGKFALVSCWFRYYDALPTGSDWFLNSTGETFRFGSDGANTDELNIYVENSGGTPIINVNTTDATITTGTWNHLLYAIDTSQATQADRIRVYLNDTQLSLTVNTATLDGVIDWTVANWSIGGIVTGGNYVKADIGQLYVSDETLDITNVNNRRLFIDANGKPVDLGPNGEKPLGTAPHIFLNNPYGSFQTNLGTGGNFSVTGELVDGGYVNDKTYSSESFTNTYEVVKSFGKENQSGTANISAGRPEDKYGVVLTLSSEIILKKVGFYLRKQNSPVGDIWCEIHGVSGTPGTNGIANNNIIARSDKIDTSLIGSSLTMQDFTFADLLILPADDYAITLNCSEVGDSTNTIHIGVHNDPDTNRTDTSAGTWTWDFSINSSPIYYLYGNKNLDLITKGSDDIGNSPSVAPEKGHMEVLLTERPAGGTSTWSKTLDSDNNHWADQSIRQPLLNADISSGGDRCRITLSGHATTTGKIDNIAIVERSGETGNGVTMPTEILFGGSSGVIIPAGGSIISDWVDFTIDASKDYLVIFDISSDTTMDDFIYTTSGPGYYNAASTNSYNTVSFSDQTLTNNANRTIIISKLEVETKPTINTDIIAEMSRDGGTTYSSVTLTRAKTNVGGSNRTIIGGEADFNGDPSGTNIVGRIRTANKDKIDIHGISVNW